MGELQMKAGMLHHRVTLQRATDTNTNGEPVKTWADVGTYWAFVKPITGNENISFNQQVQAETSCEVIMRYVGEIKAGDRLLFKSRTLHVVSTINVDEHGEEMRLMCKEQHG